MISGEIFRPAQKVPFKLILRRLGRSQSIAAKARSSLVSLARLISFASLAERERRRALMEADPAWPIYRQALLELDVVVEQSTKILRTTAFSPTIDFDQQQTA